MLPTALKRRAREHACQVANEQPNAAVDVPSIAQ